MADVDMGLNIYEFNKNIMKQLPIIEDRNKIIETLVEYFENVPFDEYLMMLCKERSDYTLFHFQGGPTQFPDDVLECFANRGLGVVNVEIIDEGVAMEIWVKEPGQMEKADLYYIFPADQMVIEY